MKQRLIYLWVFGTCVAWCEVLRSITPHGALAAYPPWEAVLIMLGELFVPLLLVDLALIAVIWFIRFVIRIFAAGIVR